VFDWWMSVGHIHTITRRGLAKAREINQAQDLSAIRVGSHDEIFQAGREHLTFVMSRNAHNYIALES
jgi:hypothetical protein